MAQVILLLTVITMQTVLEYCCLPETSQSLEVSVTSPSPPHLTDDRLKLKEVKEPTQARTAGK